jgi:hypothetical protein
MYSVLDTSFWLMNTIIIDSELDYIPSTNLLCIKLSRTGLQLFRNILGCHIIDRDIVTDKPTKLESDSLFRFFQNKHCKTYLIFEIELSNDIYELLSHQDAGVTANALFKCKKVTFQRPRKGVVRWRVNVLDTCRCIWAAPLCCPSVENE